MSVAKASGMQQGAGVRGRPAYPATVASCRRWGFAQLPRQVQNLPARWQHAKISRITDRDMSSLPLGAVDRAHPVAITQPPE